MPELDHVAHPRGGLLVPCSLHSHHEVADLPLDVQRAAYPIQRSSVAAAVLEPQADVGFHRFCPRECVSLSA